MTPWRLAMGSLDAFTGLAVSVHLAPLNTLDAIVWEWARPQKFCGTSHGHYASLTSVGAVTRT